MRSGPDPAAARPVRAQAGASSSILCVGSAELSSIKSTDGGARSRQEHRAGCHASAGTRGADEEACRCREDIGTGLRGDRNSGPSMVITTPISPACQARHLGRGLRRRPTSEFDPSFPIRDEQAVRSEASAEVLFDRVRRLIGGVVLWRGRRDPARIWTDGAIDFWRVGDDEPDRRLLHHAERKNPGDAWFAFRVRPLGDGGLGKRSRLTVLGPNQSSRVSISSPPATVPSACQTLSFICSLIVTTDPSHLSKWTPMGWRLLAVTMALP